MYRTILILINQHSEITGHCNQYSDQKSVDAVPEHIRSCRTCHQRSDRQGDIHNGKRKTVVVIDTIRKD